MNYSKSCENENDFQSLKLVLRNNTEEECYEYRIHTLKKQERKEKKKEEIK